MALPSQWSEGSQVFAPGSRSPPSCLPICRVLHPRSWACEKPELLGASLQGQPRLASCPLSTPFLINQEYLSKHCRALAWTKDLGLFKRTFISFEPGFQAIKNFLMNGHVALPPPFGSVYGLANTDELCWYCSSRRQSGFPGSCPVAEARGYAGSLGRLPNCLIPSLPLPLTANFYFMALGNLKLLKTQSYHFIEDKIKFKACHVFQVTRETTCAKPKKNPV